MCSSSSSPEVEVIIIGGEVDDDGGGGNDEGGGVQRVGGGTSVVAPWQVASAVATRIWHASSWGAASSSCGDPFMAFLRPRQSSGLMAKGRESRRHYLLLRVRPRLPEDNVVTHHGVERGSGVRTDMLLANAAPAWECRRRSHCTAAMRVASFASFYDGALHRHIGPRVPPDPPPFGVLLHQP